MTEQSAYAHVSNAEFVSRATIRERSRTMMQDFYKRQPETWAGLDQVDYHLGTLLDEIQAIPQAYLGEDGARFLAKAYELAAAATYQDDANAEKDAARELQIQFGPEDRKTKEGYLLTKPVAIELGRNNETAQEVQKTVARENFALMDEVSRLLALTILALKTEQKKAKEDEQRWLTTKATVVHIDAEGHTEVERDKQDGGIALDEEADQDKKRADVLGDTVGQLERGKDKLERSGVIFSQILASPDERGLLKAAA